MRTIVTNLEVALNFPDGILSLSLLGLPPLKLLRVVLVILSQLLEISLRLLSSRLSRLGLLL